MDLTRRGVLRLGLGATGAAGLMACSERVVFAPEASGWRRFETRATLEIARSGEGVQAWMPIPSFDAGAWMRAGASRVGGNADEARIETDAASGARFVHAVWGPGDAPALLEVTSEAEAQDRTMATGGDALNAEDRARYTAPTALIPTDGLVAETAAAIVGDETDDLAKARLIYDWVVENTARNPETRGCGLGDIGSMLRIGDLTGKCADLNALYVGLARAAGLPARDLYGLRVAPSRFGYRSLGAGKPDVTRAQHCRAEVFVNALGWIAVDPADVRKVMLEEREDELALRAPEVRAARRGLFGSWEGNWIAYNDAHDVALPGSDGPALPFLMYPQAEVGGVRRDPLSPDSFAYAIEAHELTA